MDTGVENKAKVATPGAFSSGAGVGVGQENTKVDLKKPLTSIRTALNRNLRGAKRVMYDQEGVPSIPRNASPETPP